MTDRRFHEYTDKMADIDDQFESYEGKQIPFFQEFEKNLGRPLDIRALRCNEEYVRSVQRRIARERALGWESPHEIKKTPEMKQILEKAIEWVVEEMKSIGYPLQIELSEGRVHFLRPKEYNELAGQESCGYAQVASNEVFISFDDMHKSSVYLFQNDLLDERAEESSVEEYMKKYIDILATTIHEFTHLGGYQRFYALAYGYYMRTGYTTPGQNGVEEKFLSLNEAFVEKWAREILKKNISKLGISKFTSEYIESFDFGSYNGDVMILEHIIRGIAQKRGESEESIWKTFKEGYCGGGTKHLVDIEKHFGKGTLKKYADLKPSDVKDRTDFYYDFIDKIFTDKW